MTQRTHVAEITALVCRIGQLSGLAPDVDFYEAGMASIKALEVLLELETMFGVSIPDQEFVTSRTVNNLCDLIGKLKAESEAA